MLRRVRSAACCQIRLRLGHSIRALDAVGGEGGCHAQQIRLRLGNRIRTLRGWSRLVTNWRLIANSSSRDSRTTSIGNPLYTLRPLKRVILVRRPLERRVVANSSSRDSRTTSRARAGRRSGNAASLSVFVLFRSSSGGSICTFVLTKQVN